MTRAAAALALLLLASAPAAAQNRIVRRDTYLVTGAVR